MNAAVPFAGLLFLTPAAMAAIGNEVATTNLHPIGTAQACLTSKRQSKTYHHVIPSSSSHTSLIPEATTEQL